MKTLILMLCILLSVIALTAVALWLGEGILWVIRRLKGEVI